MSFTPFETNDRVLNTRMNQLGNELLSQITKFSTYDLYLKAGNLMNTQKPTGAGTQVTFANVTDVEQLAFTFNYAIPERLIISTDNKYNLVMPFQGLESNRSYIFRYVYKHEGATIFDITRNAVTSATGNFTVEFQALNQNTADIIAEANSTVTLQIYVKTVSGTDASIAILVNDVNALGRLSRNEATAIITTDNVYEGDETQEEINAELSSAIGQKADSSDFVSTSQSLVVGSGFEAQTATSPFNVTKSGQMLYFIGQLKCLANTSASPVVLATSPLIPRGYFGLNILVNGVRQEGLVIAPGTGQIYIYKPFSANDIIVFNGFAIGDI